jgi:hypothetical protein
MRPDEGWLLSPEKSQTETILKASAWNHAFMKKLLTGVDNPSAETKQAMRVYNIDLSELRPTPVSTALNLHSFDWVDGVVRQTIYQPYFNKTTNKAGTMVRTPGESKILQEPFSTFIQTVIPTTCFNYFFYFPMFVFADGTLWDRSLENKNYPIFMRINGAPTNDSPPYGIIRDKQLIGEAQRKMLDVASITALIKAKSPMFSLHPRVSNTSETQPKISMIPDAPLQLPSIRATDTTESADTTKVTGNLIPLKL